MLQPNSRDNVNRANMSAEFSSMPAVSLAEVVAFVRRHRSVMLLTSLAALGIAALYLVTAVPEFTAKAELIINSRGNPGDATSASTVVESQIGIIKSESIARAVIEKLRLAENPGLVRQDSVIHSMTSSISRLLGWSKPETQYSAMRYVLESFEHQLSAKRVGPTYLVEIAFVSTDPDRAARILNAVAEEYITHQINKPPLQDQTWVKDRLNELGAQASAAQMTLEHYTKNRKSVVDSADTVHKLAAAAESSKNAYDNFRHLLRQMEAAQEQSLPVFEASLVSEALPPLRASSPKPRIALVISTIGGLLLGIAIGMLRDRSNRGIGASEQEPRPSARDNDIERTLPNAPRPDYQPEASAKARPVRLTSSG
jgi:uncharacterized protein involved in exopolysaccharide biosynthesis